MIQLQDAALEKFQAERAFLIPKGARKVADKLSSAVAYLYEVAGKPCAVGFRGKSGKQAFRFHYKSEERRAKHVEEFFAGERGVENYKANRQAERKAKLSKPHRLQVGHILMSSWGYDQTNIDFYEVVALVGKRMVELRPIGQVRDYDAQDRGSCSPRAGAYIGEAFKKLVQENDQVKIESYAYASLWDGKPSRWSSYH